MNCFWLSLARLYNLTEGELLDFFDLHDIRLQETHGLVTEKDEADIIRRIAAKYPECAVHMDHQPRMKYNSLVEVIRYNVDNNTNHDSRPPQYTRVIGLIYCEFGAAALHTFNAEICQNYSGECTDGDNRRTTRHCYGVHLKDYREFLSQLSR